MNKIKILPQSVILGILLAQPIGVAPLHHHGGDEALPPEADLQPLLEAVVEVNHPAWAPGPAPHLCVQSGLATCHHICAKLLV